MKQDFETFANPPIKEVIFSIDVELPNDYPVNELASIHESIQDQFPQIKDIIEYVKAFHFSRQDEDMPTDSFDKRLTGYLLTDTKEEKAVQYLCYGFIYNVVNQYSDGDLFIKECQELWQYYLNIIGEVTVKKISLRYINRIEIPIGNENPISDYFDTRPLISNKLNYSLSNYYMKLMVKDPESGSVGLITQTIEEEIGGDSIPFILDVDSSMDCDIKSTDNELWEKVFVLRGFKNELFFNCITDKTKELFR